jgi:RND superfamily putative drug exporter
MTRFVLRNKLLIVFAWLILAACGALTMSFTAARLDYTYSIPGEPGFVADQHIIRRFTIDPAWEPTLAVLRLPAGETMYSPLGQALAARAFSAARRAGILGLADYATTGNSKFILDHGRATWALINEPNPDKGPGVGMDDRLASVLNAATPPGGSMVLTGFAQMLSNAGPNAHNLLVATVLGGMLALLVMLFVYGSAIAIIPILMAIPSVLVTFLCALALTYVAPVSYFLEFMITLLSFGISIDYSLIYTIRWREERERGLTNEQAIMEAGKHGGGAVKLSGLTAAISLLSLVLLPVPFLRSVGFGSMLIPLVAVVAACTLLPVTLATIGPALDKYCLWRGSTTFSRRWESWGRVILRHRYLAAVVGVAIIVTLTLPVLWLNAAEPFVGSLSPAGPAAAAFRVLEQNGVPAAVVYPVQVITHGGAVGEAQAAAIASATPGVYTVLSPETPAFRQGVDSLLTIIPEAEAGTPEGRSLVTSLRARLKSVQGGAEVGGATAADMGFDRVVYGNFPLLLLFVSIVSLIILVRALKSPVLALKAVVLNIVSLGVAFGCMVFFWQEGHGAHFFYGVAPTGAIKYWIPVIIFASLFGLSMDYEVFVLSRMREEYDRSGSTERAILGGLARTGRLVSCAAIILMVTFLSLSADPDQIVAICGFTLAIGIVIDALVIRTLLVPSLVSLMGRWNWWMPTGLARVLRVREQRRSEG